jgi:enoyl-CoA hydratase/carnithine racemase
MSYVLDDRPEPGVVVLRLNRPERLNAIDFEAVAELHAQLLASMTCDMTEAVAAFLEKRAPSFEQK